MLKGIKNPVFDVRMYAADISGDAAFYDKWYRLMPASRCERCDRFKIEADKKRCIKSYALISYSLGDLIGTDITTFDIREGAGGKPYLSDIPVYFNISHAKERVVCALSPMEIGCDVEIRSANALSVAKRFFSGDEYRLLLAEEDEKARDALFTKLWTIKESVVKCSGEGIRRIFSDFSVVDDDGNIAGRIKLSGIDQEYHIRCFASENGYCYSLCSEYENIGDKIRFIDTSQMI